MGTITEAPLDDIADDASILVPDTIGIAEAVPRVRNPAQWGVILLGNS